jgi:DNA-directed RNA polymerase specialized sigma24 family protein
MSRSSQSRRVSANDAPHARFLVLLPRIERHARIYFRHLRCPVRREDAVQETLCLAWKWFRRLLERGKDATAFPMAFAVLAAKVVKCGRRICGQAKAKDVLNEHTQKRHGFQVETLPSSTCRFQEHPLSAIHGQQEMDEFEERLRDNTVSPVPDQAAFRIDFPAWLQTLTARERRLIRAMIRNERTRDLAKQFELSPARISQLRREFHDDWNRFCAVPGNAAPQ